LGIHHLAFATQDLPETLRFWRDLLGLAVVARLGEGEETQVSLGLTDRQLISFFSWPKVEPRPYHHPGEPVVGPFGLDHLALEWPSKEDLLALADRLAGAGYPVSEPVDHGSLWSIYTFDPNHLAVELTWVNREQPLPPTRPAPENPKWEVE